MVLSVLFSYHFLQNNITEYLKGRPKVHVIPGFSWITFISVSQIVVMDFMAIQTMGCVYVVQSHAKPASTVQLRLTAPAAKTKRISKIILV